MSGGADITRAEPARAGGGSARPPAESNGAAADGTPPAGAPPAARREQLLAAAARLMADRGYHGVSINDIGAATGVSGPAVYKHFPSKQAILTELLVGISERLLAEGTARVA